VEVKSDSSPFVMIFHHLDSNLVASALNFVILAINHLVDRFWNALFRVLRFSGGDADKLQPAEGEHEVARS
jgi:hypothetical protein